MEKIIQWVKSKKIHIFGSNNIMSVSIRMSSKRTTQNTTTPISRSSYVLFIGCFALLVLQVWAYFFPSHRNWGFHLFTFYPLWVVIVSSCCCMMLFIPSVGYKLLRFLNQRIRDIGRVQPIIILAVVIAAFIFSANYFKAQGHLLGDSMIILNLTPHSANVQDVSADFRNQPLTYYSVRLIQRILGGDKPVETIDVYRIMDIVAGLMFLCLVVWFVSHLKLKPIEKVLLGCFIFFLPMIQFFFGYVENYALLSVFTAAYFVTAWMVIEERLHPIIPILCFAMMVGLHLSAIAFSPTLLFYVVIIWRRNVWQAVIMIIMMMVGIAGLLIVANYSPLQFIQRIAMAPVYDFLPMFSPPGDIPYGIFSGLHLLDWVNAIAHTIPGAFLCTIALLPFAVTEYGWRSPVLGFLFLGTLNGLAFSFVINPALGMARDWDFLASFFLPMTFLALASIMPYFKVREGHRLMTALIVLLIVRTAVWIGVNADEEKHLLRAEMLTDQKLSGTFPKVYYDNLASAFFHKEKYDKAALWYERYMAVDSLNPRIAANLISCYTEMGNNDQTFRWLKWAVNLNMPKPGLYSNLGIEYIRRGDTSTAIGLFQRALAFDSTFIVAHANLGIYLYGRKDYQRAAYHASKAIQLGFADPRLIKATGSMYEYLGQFRNAIDYYDRYLLIRPNDNGIRQLRDQLFARLNGKRAG
jgi:hypothetical protein